MEGNLGRNGEIENGKREMRKWVEMVHMEMGMHFVLKRGY